ncbi:MAG: protein-methionine-sulfoxide reductase catalytic subunit MsrP [Verrucomicrobiota bacterium]|nr:protein-methionine-sulfoxide reductase catalytic subunit MsrP [Verrucomicrobiota bacterium]
MANIIIRPDWCLPEKLVTPEEVYRNRRGFLKELGVAGVGLAAGTGWAAAQPKYPAKRNPAYDLKVKYTDEKVATTFNNFYEFSTRKELVHRLTARFRTNPWPMRVGGLVRKPLAKVDAHELAAEMGLEERVYRFRCVEAWSMVVPWTGFPLRKLIEKVQPKPEAKFVRFATYFDRRTMPGVNLLPSYPWPYTEGLRIEEALHPLTMVVTGMYGKPLPKQNGAPIRLVVPWKYGYKSIKSVQLIEFTAKQPKTLWESLAPDEYPFESNVNPGVPHPRWSQATERQIIKDPYTQVRIRTQKYNGYGDEVAKLYARK